MRYCKNENETRIPGLIHSKINIKIYADLNFLNLKTDNLN
jgi:hypothetical protein